LCVVKPSKVDYAALCPYFGWLPTSVVEKTFKVMTQYAHMPMSTILKKQYKCHFPALNVFHCHEPVATDMVYSDTLAIDSGATCAQLFCGTHSYVMDAYGMKSHKQFDGTLEDNICNRGALTHLVSDRASLLSASVLPTSSMHYASCFGSLSHTSSNRI
jgi:hypothetical protein